MIITPNTKESELPKGVSFRWPSDEGKLYDSNKDFIEIGESVKFRPPVTVYWGVKIGNNSQIGHYTLIREYSIIGHHTAIGSFVDLEGFLSIGNNVTIHSQCIINQKTTIEDWVFVGPNCVTTNTKKIKHGRDYPLTMDGVKIHFGARLAMGCMIAPGVDIGENSMIGMGSLVIKNVPSRTIVYGHPAKIAGPVPADEILDFEKLNDKN